MIINLIGEFMAKGIRGSMDLVACIQIPPMTWHSIEVYEPSTIFEAKDGAYV